MGKIVDANEVTGRILAGVYEAFRAESVSATVEEIVRRAISDAEDCSERFSGEKQGNV